MTKTNGNFNPNEHLRTFERRQRQLDGSYKTVGIDYLDVKWRVVWFRSEHPSGCIRTELLSEPGVTPAVVKATVTIPPQIAGDDPVEATGFGQCGEDDWSDWLEKAETRAIGRALALLGYGTQFCEDFDEVISDAPVESKRAASKPPRQPRANRPSESGEMMTPNQQKYIESLARDAGLDAAELHDIAENSFGRGVDDLLKSEASQLITSLQELRDERLAEAVT